MKNRRLDEFFGEPKPVQRDVNKSIQQKLEPVRREVSESIQQKLELVQREVNNSIQQKLEPKTDKIKPLVPIMVKWAKISEEEAEKALAVCYGYLLRYHSVGTIRFFEDISRMYKIPHNIIRIAVDVLEAYKLVEIVEGLVINRREI